MFKLSKALSFQIFQDKTYLINHKTKTEFLMNKDAGKILENIENFIPQNDNEKEFINQLKVLDIIENENIKQDKKENFIKYNSSDVYSELKNYALKNAIPINCTMEISYYCTLKCKHCYLKGLRNKEKTELTTKEIKSFIDQFKKLGGTFLTITGGEPFLRNDILEIIKYARNKYIAVSILTTGNFLTKQIIDELSNLYIHQIQFSLYGANAKTHDSITQINGSFKKTMEAINYSKTKLDTHISLSINSLNINNYEELIKFVKKLNIPYSTNYIMFPFKKTAKPSPFNLNYNQIYKCLKTTKNINKGRLFEKNYNDFVCNAGRSLFSIDPFGNIKPCIEIPKIFGNIKKTELKTILKLMKNSEYTLKVKDLEDCNKCEFKNYCNRCTGLAIQEKLSEKQHSKLDCIFAKASFNAKKSM